MRAARLHPADLIRADSEKATDLVLVVLVLSIAQEFTHLLFQRFDFVFTSALPTQRSFSSITASCPCWDGSESFLLATEPVGHVLAEATLARDVDRDGRPLLQGFQVIVDPCGF